MTREAQTSTVVSGALGGCDEDAFAGAQMIWTQHIDAVPMFFGWIQN